MRRTLLTLGLIALAIGLLWIGQGTGAVAWPRSSFMINEIQWAGYGAVLSAVGLILIWQSQRPWRLICSISGARPRSSLAAMAESGSALPEGSPMPAPTSRWSGAT